MGSVVIIGVDLGKIVFQVYGVDAGGAVVVQRCLTRGKVLQFFAKLVSCRIQFVILLLVALLILPRMFVEMGLSARDLRHAI
jgi:hypothetical protein